MPRTWLNVNDVKVLVVDDDAAVRDSLARTLKFEGHEVETAADGEQALDAVRTAEPDAMILDVSMPRLDGLETCRRLRADGVVLPVLMLTARDSVGDRVAGLDAGADDYLVKPFVLAELVARVTAVLRRLGRSPSTVEVGDLLVDAAAGSVLRAGVPVELTATELRLLDYLATQRGRVVSKGQILTRVWGYTDYDPNLVEVHVSALRRKLGEPRLVHTVRGLGYVLRADGT